MADRDLDNTPSFSFRPGWTGEYIVQLELARCETRRCQAGAVVIAR